MADGDFYHRDRPESSTLPEDRPRGRGPEEPSPSRMPGPARVIIIALVIIAIIVFGLMLI